MGCAPSQPSRPPPQRQPKHPAARLSRPFDWDAPLHPKPTPSFNVQRHGDAFAQLTARSQKKAPPPPPRKTHAPAAKSQKQARLSRPFDPKIPVSASRPFDKARHGDAFAQLNARSGKSQVARKDQRVRFERGRSVKSQKARVQGCKGDTLYFANQCAMSLCSEMEVVEFGWGKFRMVWIGVAAFVGLVALLDVFLLV